MDISPHTLDDALRKWARAEQRWRQNLRSGTLDPTGPFASTPLVTERDWFRTLAQLPWPEPLRNGLLRWSFRLTDARVNAAAMAAIEFSYRVETHTILLPQPLRVTGYGLLHATLTDPPRREAWQEAWSTVAAPTGEAVLRWWERRVELGRRVGLSSLDEVESSGVDGMSLGQTILGKTEPLYASLGLSSFSAYLETALGVAAEDGWPAHLTLRTLVGLLGSDELVLGVAPEPYPLPQPVAPASFLRALCRLGASLVRAHAPAAQPFVISHDPSGLGEHIFGALLGSLPTQPSWQLRIGGAQSRDSARERARCLTRVKLLHLRFMALSATLRHRVLGGTAALVGHGPDDVEQALGLPWSRSLLGVSPRILPDACSRLLGCLLAEELHNELVQRFDEDWFRNPRALEELRHRLNNPPVLRVTPEAVEHATALTLTELQTRL
jgi:hypothetical protein